MSSNGDVESSTPPRKRPRTNGYEASKSHNARLYAPFRALGLVTNHVPLAIQARSYKGAAEGARLHILTCLGRSWAMWEGGKMTLLFVGTDAPDPISCLVFDGDNVWASSGISVLKYVRGKEVRRVSNPLGGNIASICIFGDRLLALTDDGTRLLIFSRDDGELSGTIEFGSDFTATIILHPATYINKILIGSSQGSLQLWNIRSLTCIHKFDAARLRDNADSKTPCAIMSLVQSPAIDVVAIGFLSGEISIYDIRADERLLRISMDGGGVQSLGFRSDGKGILASASTNGHIALWDLNEGGRLLHIIRGAHDSAVSSIEWIPGQPVLISSGGDNSVKQWVCDSATAPPRLLKFRSGHHQPPHLIRYYGDDGKQILTASRDRSLRYTSVVRDSRSFELSQGSIAKKANSLSIPLTSLKFPPVNSLSFSSARSKDWDDVITSHTQETFARTWTVREKKVGKWRFIFEPQKSKGKDKKQKRVVIPGAVQCVCVTACGNFGLAGNSTGEINMWNMQSGILRKSFSIGPRPVEITRPDKSSDTDRSVTGIATDALNRLVIASTLDGTLNFFDFHTKELLHTLILSANISSILLQRDSGLLAVVCDDLIVRVVDIELRKVVRELSGFRGRILDVTFSPDSRWLVASSLDATIRTFDLPTCRLIDAFRTPSVATSITFSPTNDFLATAHVDSVGIFLWANRSQYADVTFQGVLETNVGEVQLPSMQDEVEDDALDTLSALKVDEPADPFTTPTQLDGELITLTLLPRSRWQTLLNLDVIQERNKPKEPPKAPERAPFFLPTLPGVEHRFAATSPQKDEQQNANKGSKRRLEKNALKAESIFYKKLMSEDPEGDYEDLFTYTKMLTPAAIDMELRSLVTLESHSLFLNALLRRLQTKRDFEAVQTFMNVFLLLHGEVLVANPELRESMEALKKVQLAESGRLLELITSSLGSLGFVRDVL